jgi:hypothetical protein
MEWSEGNTSLKNPVISPGIDAGNARLVEQRLNHYATPDPTRVIQRHLNNVLTTTSYRSMRCLAFNMVILGSVAAGRFSTQLS